MEMLPVHRKAKVYTRMKSGDSESQGERIQFTLKPRQTTNARAPILVGIGFEHTSQCDLHRAELAEGNSSVTKFFSTGKILNL